MECEAPRPSQFIFGMKPGMHQGGDGLILMQVLLHDRQRILRLNAAVPDAIRHHPHRRAGSALPHAVAALNQDTRRR